MSIPINNKCCFFSIEGDKYLKSFVEEKAQELQQCDHVYTLGDLGAQAENSIDKSRDSLKTLLPFRIKFCKFSGVKCCGTCTLTCNERCVQDAYTKLGIYLTSHCKKPFKDNIKTCDYLTQSVYNLLVNPCATYEQLVAMVNQVIGVRQNFQIKNRMRELGVRGQEQRRMSVWRLDYAPQPQYYEVGKTGKLMRKVDKATGKILFMDWPTTGLCPYCLPKVTVDRHYGKDYDLK